MIHSDTFQGDTMRWLEGALTTGLVSWNATPITDGCETLPVASSESVRPALAESLEVSEDGRQITVTLRENMKSKPSE